MGYNVGNLHVYYYFNAFTTTYSVSKPAQKQNQVFIASPVNYLTAKKTFGIFFNVSGKVMA